MCVCVCVCVCVVTNGSVVNGYTNAKYVLLLLNTITSSLNTTPLQSVQELRGLMDEVRTLKTEREVIETTLRDPVSDISE